MKNKIDLEPYHNAHANFVLMSIPMLEVCDALSKTNMYQKGLKKALNEVIRELEKNDLNERLASLWECDEEAVNQITDRYMNICKRLSTCDPETWSTFDSVIDMLVKNKEYVLHRLNILSGTSKEIKDMEVKENLFARIANLPVSAMTQIDKYISGLENIYLCNT